MQGAHPYTLGVAVLVVRDVAIVLEEVPPDFRISRLPVHPVPDVLPRLAVHLVYSPIREPHELSLLSRNGLHVSFVLQIVEDVPGVLFGGLA
jgi:hypothetical protein